MASTAQVSDSKCYGIFQVMYIQEGHIMTSFWHSDDTNRFLRVFWIFL